MVDDGRREERAGLGAAALGRVGEGGALGHGVADEGLEDGWLLRLRERRDGYALLPRKPNLRMGTHDPTFRIRRGSILFIFSLFYEYSNLESVHIHSRMDGFLGSGRGVMDTPSSQGS